MRKRLPITLLSTFLAAAGLTLLPPSGAEPVDTLAPGAGRAPYPTAAIADYVVGCMLANGASQETLQKCACSFDRIAAAIPYRDYEQVETLMQLQQVQGGGRAGAFKGSAWANSAIAHFKEVQAESTLRCF